MKIYRVCPDVNSYQYFMLETDDPVSRKMLDFDGKSKGTEWVAPAVYIYKPKLTMGNFPGLWSTAALVVDEVALQSLRGLLERSGELLPLPYKDKIYNVLNVTECVNLLDGQKTQWLYEPGSLPIQKYAFHSHRLSEAPLFTIPETCDCEILTCEGLDDPEHEFKGRVEQLGLKGLVFREIWNSDE